MGVNRGKRRGVALVWQLTFQGSQMSPGTERQRVCRKSLSAGDAGLSGSPAGLGKAELEFTFFYQLKSFFEERKELGL